MRADAQSGEAEFRYAEGQNGYLSELASMPTFAPSQPDPALPPPSTPLPQEETVEQKKSKPKGRVGEPSPRRDQVGIAQEEGEATHCSFSGPIKLEATRWLESNVQEVQCTTCGSVSKAKLKEQSVVIAPHPPRKSRPVRNVTRWTEQGFEWVLVQRKRNLNQIGSYLLILQKHIGYLHNNAWNVQIADQGGFYGARRKTIQSLSHPSRNRQRWNG